MFRSFPGVLVAVALQLSGCCSVLCDLCLLPLETTAGTIVQEAKNTPRAEIPFEAKGTEVAAVRQ